MISWVGDHQRDPAVAHFNILQCPTRANLRSSRCRAKEALRVINSARLVTLRGILSFEALGRLLSVCESFDYNIYPARETDRLSSRIVPCIIDAEHHTKGSMKLLHRTEYS